MAFTEFAKKTAQEFVDSAAPKSCQKIPLNDLTTGNPLATNFNFPQKRLKRLLEQAVAANLAKYQPTARGSLQARTALATYYAHKHQSKLSPDSFYLTASTSEAYSLIFKLLTNSQDLIAVPTPSYPLIGDLALLENLELVSYPLVYQKSANSRSLARWQIDFQSLDRLLQQHAQRLKALILINPDNPTGSYLTLEESKRLLTYLERYQIALIVDEVFLPYTYPPNSQANPSFTRLLKPSKAYPQPPLSFVLNGLSKSLALPQLKLSWFSLHGTPELQRAAHQRLTWLLDNYLSVNSLSEAALPQLLPLATTRQKLINQRLQQNYLTLQKFGQQYPTLTVLQLTGGFYAILRTPYILEEEALCAYLAKTAGLQLFPGHFYGFTRPSYLILSLLPPPPRFKQGLKSLAAALAKLQYL